MAAEKEGGVELESSSRTSPAAFAKARETRPDICGSDAPERPYPIYLRGVVERGFGRGGKDLGCPTANLPSKVLQSQSHLNRTGVYYGFARILPQDPDDPDLAEVGEQGAPEPTPITSSQEENVASTAEDGQQQLRDELDYEDPEDDEWEVDEDEVVLGASPPPRSAMEEDPREAVSVKAITDSLPTKPRQTSRSSARSSRSTAGLMEKVHSLGLERTVSNQSQTQQGQASPGLLASGEVVPTSGPYVDSAPPAKVTKMEDSGVPFESHDRGVSNASNASSIRRRKKIRISITSIDQRVFPMVMSIGWNPFYKNTMKTAEVHIMHKFASDFYGLEMRVVVLGYIRPEFNYVSKEALIEDIEMDKRVAINSLGRTLYQDYSTDPFLLAPS